MPYGAVRFRKTSYGVARCCMVSCTLPYVTVRCLVRSPVRASCGAHAQSKLCTIQALFPLIHVTRTANSLERSSSGSVLVGPLEKGISAHMGLHIALCAFCCTYQPCVRAGGLRSYNKKCNKKTRTDESLCQKHAVLKILTQIDLVFERNGAVVDLLGSSSCK